MQLEPSLMGRAMIMDFNLLFSDRGSIRERRPRDLPDFG